MQQQHQLAVQSDQSPPLICRHKRDHRSLFAILYLHTLLILLKLQSEHMLSLSLRIAVLLKGSPTVVDMLHLDTMSMQDFSSRAAERHSLPLMPIISCRIDIPGTIGSRARKVALQLLQVNSEVPVPSDIAARVSLWRVLSIQF